MLKAVRPVDKPIIWFQGEVKSPPFSPNARRKAGFLLRLLQRGNVLSMPDSRPMPSVGARCHELRINDPSTRVTWRIMYRIDHDAIVIAEVFAKQSRATPKNVIDVVRKRLERYDRLTA